MFSETSDKLERIGIDEWKYNTDIVKDRFKELVKAELPGELIGTADFENIFSRPIKYSIVSYIESVLGEMYERRIR